MDYSTEEDFSTFTTKRRRTKRHRSLLSASASASSTYCGGSDGAVITAAASDPPNKATAASSTSYASSSSASPSDHLNDVMSEVVTTEEIDMANFLILLSQGLHKNTNNSNTNTNNTVLYECKTCNRTFSSFQALGGHRTSHKKIKPPLSPSIIPSTDHHNSDNNIDTKIKIVDNKVRDRVHECSICGSEFPSGQALGGHMRRHRAAPPPPSSAEITPDGSTEVIDTGGGGPRNILSLDLNLPAPDDQDPQQDDHMENTFVHVLPRPAPLVDCHN